MSTPIPEAETIIAYAQELGIALYPHLYVSTTLAGMPFAACAVGTLLLHERQQPETPFTYEDWDTLLEASGYDPDELEALERGFCDFVLESEGDQRIERIGLALYKLAEESGLLLTSAEHQQLCYAERAS